MPNVMQAQFNGISPLPNLRQVEVIQRENNHTLVLLNYAISERSQYSLPLEQSPFVLRWGSSPLGLRTFYGYVNHFESINSEETPGKVETQLVGMGTSQPFNASESRNFAGYTRSGIAREFAKKYRLRSVIHAHPEVLENWATGLDSDFICLKRLADECGYYSWVDGSTLYFLDPKRPFDTATKRVPTFTSGQIRHAKVLGGTNAPREQGNVRRRVLHGLDATTNEFFTATSGSPEYLTETLSAPVNTYAEATQVTKSSGKRDDDYYTLTATVEGDANLYPGGLARLSGNQISNDQEGYWQVRAARHTLTVADFSTRLEASRGLKKTPNLTSLSALRDTRERTAAVVRDGRRWEAQVQEHVNV